MGAPLKIQNAGDPPPATPGVRRYVVCVPCRVSEVSRRAPPQLLHTVRKMGTISVAFSVEIKRRKSTTKFPLANILISNFCIQ